MIKYIFKNNEKNMENITSTARKPFFSNLKIMQDLRTNFLN